MTYQMLVSFIAGAVLGAGLCATCVILTAKYWV